ncbi:DUF6879 family protein [Streptomyces shenzhenensis]|uniref:DUF6879 domain-containing protein n=1 Tax=Streptomyces shenzhenensis TaxID=943815 RepID=A0A3M0IFR6_9ACTN|nr:DUF6879 family protein [Streptomyces shenzhenensis]RMB85633.1 hypothetical protein CTZ28_12665 [Streptomyces shenzhenensis]
MVAEPTLEDRLRACRHSALHLEMRDGYMRSDARFIAWQAGQRDDPADNDPTLRPWLALMSETAGRGVEVRRARIVSEPVSDYIRFEHHVTAPNVAAGEQVRWLPRRRASDLALPGNDFWLIDDQLVVFLHFAGDGELAPDDEEVTTDPAVVKLCVDAFDAVWKRAVPHAEYRPS